MYNQKFNEDLLDAMLKRAFTDYVEAEQKAYPSARILEEKYPLPQKEMKHMRRRANRRKSLRSPASVYVQRAAIIVLSVVTVSIAALMSVPSVQAAVFETITEIYDTIRGKYSMQLEDADQYTSITFTEQPSETTDQSLSVQEQESDEEQAIRNTQTVAALNIGYIPEGYELVASLEHGSRWYLYRSQENPDQYIKIDVGLPVGKIEMDNERHAHEVIQIHSYEAYLFYAEEEQNGSLIFMHGDVLVHIYAAEEKEELIKIAENIQ